MADYNVLGWQNENGLTNYPFVDPFDIQDLFVDASFIQFDNFIPRLSSVLVGSDYISITITFDSGDSMGTITHTDYINGNRAIRYYDSVTNRYLGCLTTGEGVNTAWASFVGQDIRRNQPFISSTVRSIPSKDAVYTLDNSYGDITFSSSQDVADVYTDIGGIVYQTVAGGNTVFYNINNSIPAITFNAVANHAIPANNKIYPLKKINLVNPIKNNVYLDSNDVVKFNSINNQNLSIYLVGQNGAGSSIVPSTLSH
jgi:hypothetical protein